MPRLFLHTQDKAYSKDFLRKNISFNVCKGNFTYIKDVLLIRIFLSISQLPGSWILVFYISEKTVIDCMKNFMISRCPISYRIFGRTKTFLRIKVKINWSHQLQNPITLLYYTKKKNTVGHSLLNSVRCPRTQCQKIIKWHHSGLVNPDYLECVRKSRNNYEEAVNVMCKPLKYWSCPFCRHCCANGDKLVEQQQ